MTVIFRRAFARKAMWEYLTRAYGRGIYPTTDEVADVGMKAAPPSIDALVGMFRRWMVREALSLLEEKDPATKLRRNLLVLHDDGIKRWHPHGQMSFADLDNSGRFVTRPQADQQARAERRRDVEREVVRAMEQEFGRPISADEAWPRVEPLLKAEGLL